MQIETMFRGTKGKSGKEKHHPVSPEKTAMRKKKLTPEGFGLAKNDFWTKFKEVCVEKNGKARGKIRWHFLAALRSIGPRKGGGFFKTGESQPERGQFTAEALGPRGGFGLNMEVNRGGGGVLKKGGACRSGGSEDRKRRSKKS